jgi:hypothetical protein
MNGELVASDLNTNYIVNYVLGRLLYVHTCTQHSLYVKSRWKMIPLVVAADIEAIY